MNRRDFVKISSISTFTAAIPQSLLAKKDQPNILWLISEDICANLACYGEPVIKTPVLDKLAKDGIRFSNTYVTGPVCSASRSALMTGMYQTSIGAHHHRTKQKKPLPEGVKPITHHLRDAGYYTALMSKKTDLNFEHDKKQLFDGKDWKDRKPGQPFFVQWSFSATHRGFKRDPDDPIDPTKVRIPPYYPDHKLMRRDFADYLESIQTVDKEIGGILKRLDDEGIADNTMVIFIGDHGRCMPRGKQFCYDGGLQIPLIIRWPKKIKPGQVRDDMTSSIDISATILDMAGVKLPDHLQGRSFLPEMKNKRKYIFAARDRCDGTYDRIRAVRSKEFKYIKNFYPERPYTQLNAYKESKYPSLALLRALYKQGKLTPAQAHFMKPTRPEEELYDLKKDPWEIKNLAKDSKYKNVLEEYRGQLNKWIKESGDKGETPEDEAEQKKQYDAMLKKHLSYMKRCGFPPEGDPEKHLAIWMDKYFGDGAKQKKQKKEKTGNKTKKKTKTKKGKKSKNKEINLFKSYESLNLTDQQKKQISDSEPAKKYLELQQQWMGLTDKKGEEAKALKKIKRPAWQAFQKYMEKVLTHDQIKKMKEHK